MQQQILALLRRCYLGHSSEIEIILSSLFGIELSMNLNNIVRITNEVVKCLLIQL